MKNLLLHLTFFVLLSCLSLPANAGEPWQFDHFNKWNNVDKSLLALNYTIGTVDMFQTHDIFHDERFYEKNPVINWGVDKMGHAFIPTYFVASAVAVYAVTGTLKGKYRTTFLAMATAIEFEVVRNNVKLGVGMRF
jgi:hypothetical protein